MQNVGEKSFFGRFGLRFLFLALFFIPLVIFPTDVFTVQFGKGMIIAILTFLFVLAGIISVLKRGTMEYPRFLLPVAGVPLVVVTLVSAFMTGARPVSFFGNNFEVDTLVAVLLGALLLLLPALAVRRREHLSKALVFSLASFWVVFLYEVLKFILPASFTSFGILTSSVSNPVGSWNDLALYAGLVTVLSLVLWNMLSPGRFRNLARISLILSVLGLIVTNFVTAWYLVAFFSFASLLYHSSFSRKTSGESSRNVFSMSSLAVCLLSVFFTFAGVSLGERISRGLNIQYLGVELRFGTTAALVQNVFSEHPFLGIGPNTFVQVWDQWKPLQTNREIYWNVDFDSGSGTIISSPATVGILGLAAWLFFLVLFVRQGAFLLRRGGETDPFLRTLSVAVFAGGLYLFASLLFSSPSVSIFLLTFLFAGLFSASAILSGKRALARFDFASESGKNFAASFFLVVLIGVLGAAVFFSGEKLLAHYYFGKGLATFNASQNIENTGKYIERAVNLYSDDLYVRALSELYLIQATQIASTANPDNPDEARAQFQKFLQASIQQAQAARTIDPANYRNLIGVARAYEPVVQLRIPEASTQAYELSKAAYQSALALTPNNPSVQLLAGRLEVLHGDMNAARTEIQKAIVLKPNYTEAVFLLAQLEVSEGNIRKAIESIEAATTFTNDPAVFFQLGFLQYSDRNYRKTIEALEEAVRLEPAYSNARYFLGLALDRVGRRDDAIAQFEEIRKYNPDNQEVKFILANLTAGKAPFAEAEPPIDDQPEKRKTLPVSEETQGQR